MLTLDQIDGANRPTLVLHCVELGHDQIAAQQLGVPALKTLARDLIAAKGNTGSPVAVPTGTAGTGKLGALVGALADDIAPLVATAVRNELRAEFAAALDNRPKETRIEIKLPEISEILQGLYHASFPQALRYFMARENIYLHGPAGSGKTNAARQLAEALSKMLGVTLAWATQSFSPTSQPHELLGVPAIGSREWQPSILYRIWKFGGVWLGDEFDKNAEIIVILNAALGEVKGQITFANGETVERHEHCFIMTAGNTTGQGATSDYVTSARMDRASLDRFVMVEWPYDESLERAIVGSSATAQRWVKHVQRVRKAVSSMGASAPDILVSPRASLSGSRILAVSPETAFDELDHACLYRGLPSDDVSKIRAAYAKVK